MRAKRLVTATALAGLAAASGLAGCRGTEIEDALARVSWFSNMRDQPAVEPYEEPGRLPPEGTVMVGAGIPSLALPDDYKDIPNPVASTPEALEIGKDRFDIFCGVCHGSEGAGGGSIEGPFPRGLINRLVARRARELTDGYIFGMISVGRGLMPSYRRIPQVERWYIVNYVRQLQEQSPGNTTNN